MVEKAVIRQRGKGRHADEWTWTLYEANGQVIATDGRGPGQGYVHLTDCANMMVRILGGEYQSLTRTTSHQADGSWVFRASGRDEPDVVEEDLPPLRRPFPYMGLEDKPGDPHATGRPAPLPPEAE